MKQEWKKDEKEIYSPKNKATEVIVPKYKYFAINCVEAEESESFFSRATLLHTLSQDIKTLPKRGFYPGGYFEYALYPLEAVWENEKKECTLMLRQPTFVTDSVARMAITSIISNKPHPLISEVGFMAFEEGHCVQILHKGSLSLIGESLKKLEEYINENGLKRKDATYRTVFLKDLKKTVAEKQEIIVRVGVV